MKTALIKLHKTPILEYVDNETYKRVDASMTDQSKQTQNAVASDSDDMSDAYLLNEFCDNRDAKLRTRLEFCLIPDEPCDKCLTFDNVEDVVEDYVYHIKVDDKATCDSIKAAGKMIESYIKRGAIFSWYRKMGVEPTDTEIEIQALEDDIVSILRGQAWGKRPMQPFGPAQSPFSRRRF